MSFQRAEAPKHRRLRRTAVPDADGARWSQITADVSPTTPRSYVRPCPRSRSWPGRPVYARCWESPSKDCPAGWARRSPGRRRQVLLVAHDAVVLMLRRLIEGLSWQELGDVVQAGPVANASVTRRRQTEGRLQLIDYNRTDHL